MTGRKKPAKAVKPAAQAPAAPPVARPAQAPAQAPAQPPPPPPGPSADPHELGELDAYLMREGKHPRLYDKLGSHPADGGTRFAVWA
ncbi:MAG TPA: hypothetical protein VHE35_33585, partial [Kofleriaceae bacterium]|nr:hypothetical protein [Kofleriaceae bacterium]